MDARRCPRRAGEGAYVKPRIARTVPRSVAAKRPGDSAQHLRLVRGLPCCVTGCRSRAEPHHLLRIGGLPKGTGRKNEDRWVVPVCRKHHDAAHAAGNDEAWFAGQGVQARDLAIALWACRLKDDFEEAMFRVVFRAKQGRG